MEQDLRITIYALQDPRNNEIRYVGQAKDVLRRYRQHLYNCRNTDVTLHSKWLLRLRELRLEPALLELEHISDQSFTFLQRQARTREKYWLDYYLAQEHDCLNMVWSVGRGVPRERIWALGCEKVAPGELVGTRVEVKIFNLPRNNEKNWRIAQDALKQLTRYGKAGWTLDYALARMRINPLLHEALAKEPRLQPIIDRALYQRNYSGYNRTLTYYELKQRVNFLVGWGAANRELWGDTAWAMRYHEAVIRTIDDLLPADNTDLADSPEWINVDYRCRIDMEGTTHD